MRLTTALIGLFTLSAAVAGATVWHVLPDGSGDAPTIAAAIQLAAPDDIVEVACGTYHESDIPLASGITVRGATGDPACVEIVAAGGSGFLCEHQTGVVLEGLTVRDGNAVYGAGLYCYVSTLTIRDCVFRNGHATGDGGITCYGSTLTLERCRFEDNFSYNDGAGAVWIRHSTAVIADCVFADNVGDGGGGAFWLDESDVTVTGCTFVGNRAGDEDTDRAGSVALSWPGEDGAFRFEGCTMVGNTGTSVITTDGPSLQLTRILLAFNAGEAIHAYQDVAPIMSCCDLFANAGGDWTGPLAPLLGQDGNISDDPVFCDAGTRDFHLETDSPCAPDANIACGLIGAWPVGCAITSAPSVMAGGAAVLHPAAPNPFNPRTRLAFDLAGPAQVTLDITDVAGRRLALLRQGRLGAGHHEVVWDGRDDAGRALPSGLYLCRLVAGGDGQMQRLALIR